MSRAPTSEETFGQRFMAWREGLRAFTHHFLIGAGPGQFRSVTSFLFPLSFVKPAPGEVFTDAHNFVVEYLTTTGILGAGALLLWLAVVFGRPAARCVARRTVLIAMELAEPLNAAVFPVALGAARSRRPSRRSRPASTTAGALHAQTALDPLPLPGRVIVAVMTVVGLVAGNPSRHGGRIDAPRAGPVRPRSGLGCAHAAGRPPTRCSAAWPDPAELFERDALLPEPRRPPRPTAAGRSVGQRSPCRATRPTRASSSCSRATSWPRASTAPAQQSALRGTEIPALVARRPERRSESRHCCSARTSEARHWFALSLEVEPKQPAIRDLYDGTCKLDAATHRPEPAQPVVQGVLNRLVLDRPCQFRIATEPQARNG